MLKCYIVKVFVECYIESFQGAVMHRWHRDERDLDSSVDSRQTGTVLHCYSDTLLHCYNVTLLQCYNVTLLQCYNDTLSFRVLQCYIVTLVHCYICGFWIDLHRRSRSHRHH